MNTPRAKKRLQLHDQGLKTVIVTGGGSGIGFATAELLIEAGDYRVVLLGRDGPKLEDAAKRLGGVSDTLGYVDCDLRDSAQIKRAVERVAQTSPGIYGLVNNAGIYPFGGITNTSEAAWDEAMEVNLKAPFLMIQAVVQHMAKSGQGGRIVNVSSTAGLLPNHFALAYSVSKGALVHLTKTLAKELGKDAITINCVCPGIVRTAMHEAYHRSDIELEEFYAKRGAAFPLGRVGEPQDVGGAIRYLLSKEASWVTGDTLVVDGGRLLL